MRPLAILAAVSLLAISGGPVLFTVPALRSRGTPGRQPVQKRITFSFGNLGGKQAPRKRAGRALKRMFDKMCWCRAGLTPRWCKRCQLHQPLRGLARGSLAVNRGVALPPTNMADVILGEGVQLNKTASPLGQSPFPRGRSSF